MWVCLGDGKLVLGFRGVGVGEGDKGVRGVVRWVRENGKGAALDWGRMNGEEWYDISFEH